MRIGDYGGGAVGHYHAGEGIRYDHTALYVYVGIYEAGAEVRAACVYLFPGGEALAHAYNGILREGDVTFQYFVCKYINYPGILYHKRCLALKGRSDKFGLFHRFPPFLILNAVDTPTWAP